MCVFRTPSISSIVMPKALGALLVMFISNLGVAQEFVPGELIIKTKSKMLPRTSPAFFGKLSAKGMSLKGSFGRSQVHHLKLQASQDLKKTIEELSRDPDIEYVEPNYIIRKSGKPPGIEKVFSAPEEMVSALATVGGTGYQQSFAPVAVNEAWLEITPVTATKPVVAILDTGIDDTHYVFTQSGGLWTNSDEIAGNGVDDDNNGYIDDINGWNFYAGRSRPWDDDGHGTHVSGIVLGLSLDIFKNPLLEAKIQVMALKFLGADGSGDTASAVRAVDYAVANGAKVINASWGGSSYSRALHEAMSRAYSSGILIVTAAGNSGSNNDQMPIYPASFEIPGLIAVAASNSQDSLTSFSNFGANSVHVAAPGLSIGSTYPRNTFGYASGTSMASPFVAGMAAMMLRESNQLSGFQLKDLILQSIDTSIKFSGKLYAPGRVNVLKGIRSAKNLANASTVVPSYSATVPDRVLASENGGSSGGGSAGGGCGTISVIKAFGDKGSSTPSGGAAAPVIVLLFLPVIVWLLIRSGVREAKAVVSGEDLRLTERVDVSETITIKTKNGNFEVQLKNISGGGLGFHFQDLELDKDECVTFILRSKNGGESVEVSGRIAWTDAKSHAGVQFNALNDYIHSFLLRSYARI
ncbi:MAG: hypothetical protein RJB66_2694 [Pseudomonadota bacterium]